MEWWQGSTFYEIFPASFQDSTKGADGIGDLRGIIMRLDYLKELGVRTIRLNSIFPASHYPEYYSEISNMTDVNKDLGTIEDFSVLVREIKKRNMSIVLDLPLYPFVKNLSNQSASIAKVNGTEWLRDKRDAANDRVREPSALPASVETIRDVLASIPPPLKKARREVSSSSRTNHQQEDPISKAIKFWQLKGVNGFYLQGLEHYVDEDIFVKSLIYWKSLLYPNNIFICHIKVLKNAISISAKNSILSRINLLDVTLRLTNSTMDIKTQIEQITKGTLFDKPAYPWIHWSVGGVYTSRVASTINVKNASVAASLLSMMLPGTPSIFYGDEVRIKVVRN